MEVWLVEQAEHLTDPAHLKRYTRGVFSTLEKAKAHYSRDWTDWADGTGANTPGENGIQMIVRRMQVDPMWRQGLE